MKEQKLILNQIPSSFFQQHSRVQSRTKHNNSMIQEKSLGKASALDLKKINLAKNPQQSNSSLELLILLLSRSLKFSLEEILGLFTNQNKYLAHIIVKGVNDDFKGIRLFYTFINQNLQTLIRLYQEDQDDAFACFYAIKPGFISKDPEVSSSTMDLFMNFEGVYDWFVSKESKCSNTLLLGIKRHSDLVQKYAKTLFAVIQNHEIEYFKSFYVDSIGSPNELIMITGKILSYLAKKFDANGGQSLIQELQKNGTFEKWFEIAQEVYEGTLDDKISVIIFIGEFMLYLPRVIEKNQIILNSLRQNWTKYPLHVFIPLFNQILVVLQKIANAKSSMSKNLYNVIIDVFNDTYETSDKRQFIVNGFFSILSQFPSIPSDLFIKNYHLGRLDSFDFLLICEAIDISNEERNLIKIGEIVKEIFIFDVITNFYIANLIPEIIKKIIHFETKETLAFIDNLFKVILSNYVACFIKIKGQKTNSNSEDAYFGKKKTLEKATLLERNETTIFLKKCQLILDLCEKIIDVILESDANTQQSYASTLKNYIMVTDSEVRKNNFGMSSKRLTNILQKKLKLTKEDEAYFDDQNRQNLNKSGILVSNSSLNKKVKESYGAISALSRVQVSERVIKQFDEIIAKRKKQEEQKVEQQIKKNKEVELKKVLYKKQLQKMNLIKGGFGEGQVQLKEEGFWQKLIKQTDQIKVFTNQQVEDVHLQAANLIIKRFSKLLKYFFFNYSCTMYTVKATNFDQNQLRKETLNAVEIIKFLKDYHLIFPTTLQEIQNLVKQINIKIQHRKEVVNELDYEGFEEFIRQFCLCIWNRSQASSQKHQKLDHLSLPELVQNFIDYLKTVFKQKGENMSFFETVQTIALSITPEVKQLNDRLEQNPNLILPEGFKKKTDKMIDFKPLIKTNFLSFNYRVCVEVLDELIFHRLCVHLIQPYSQKVVRVTAKPFNQITVRDRDPFKIKARALSTIIDRKVSAQSSLEMALTKNDLSKGVKKAMLLLKNQDKILGEQAAFALEQMLIKVCQSQEALNLNQLKHSRNSGNVERKRGLSQQSLEYPEKEGKGLNPLKQRNLEKIKLELMEKKQQRIEQQKKRAAEVQQKLKRKKQQEEKYYQELKQKVEERKKTQNLIENQKNQIGQLHQKKKLAKEKFQNFNSKQIDRLKKEFEEISERKKKIEEKKQISNEENQEKIKKIKNKIENEDKIITQIRKQTLEGIIEICFSESFKSLTKKFQGPLKKVFEYLQKENLNPLADRKCSPGQIDLNGWLKFNKIFEISPLIVHLKDIINIFKTVTKDKRVSKDYSAGLNYQQFLQCLLRESIKQKTVFRKISERIKDEGDRDKIKDSNTKKQKNTSVKVDPKNQFEEEEEPDLKKLLKEPDIRDDIIDHYGDISKFTIESFKGLIYYLKMPLSKKEQQKRIKELIELENKPQIYVSVLQKLKEKLKAEYSLGIPSNQKKSNSLEAVEPKKRSDLKQTKLQKKQNSEKEDTKGKKLQKK